MNETLSIPHRSASTVRIAAHVCGAVSVFVLSLYWACILLPAPYWHVVCPWGKSGTAFGEWMLGGLVLGIFASWKGSRWWLFTIAYALLNLVLAGSSV